MKRNSAWKIRLLTLTLGLLTLPTVARSETAEKEASPAQPAIEANMPTGDWLAIQNGGSLTGEAQGKLAEKLQLKWKMQGADALSGPVVYQNRVYVGSLDGTVYAVNAKDGAIAWQYKADAPVWATPLVSGDYLVVADDMGTFYALDTKTGNLKWKTATEDGIEYGLNLWTKGTKRHIVAPSSLPGCTVVDLDTGKKLWTVEADEQVNGAVCVSGDKAYFGTCGMAIHVMDMEKQESETTAGGAHVTTAPTIRDGKMYFGTSEDVECVDMKSGDFDWYYIDGDEVYWASPAVSDTHVVIGSRDDRVHCMDRKTGKSLWTFETGDDVDASPIVCDGKVVVGSLDGRVYMLSLNDGKKLWSYDIGQAVDTAPALGAGLLLVGGSDGVLYAFGPDNTQ